MPKTHSAATKAAVVDEYSVGTSAPDIAAKYGVARSTVVRWARAQNCRVRSLSEAKRVPYPYGDARLDCNGYVVRSLHPDFWLYKYGRSGGSGRRVMLEHRLCMAIHLERPLEAYETIHHINGDRTDNRISNLQVRKGKHGNGQRWVCASCGCADLKAAPLGA